MPSPSICEQKPRQLTQALRAWFGTARGQRLLQAERELIHRLSEGVFGYHLVQVQDFGHGLEALADCPVRKRCLLDLTGGEGVGLLAAGEQLPLKSDSIDLVVLPHTLDFAIDPHQVLREAERVLIPEGRVLIIGFNPLSLWGLWRLFLRWRGKVPWCGHFLAYRRIVDWLGLLGFDVEYADVCAFAPPFDGESWIRRTQGLERLGRRVWPMLAGVYAVRAVKRVSTVRPIRTPWRGLRVFRPRAIEPTTRNSVTRGTGK